MNTKQRWRFILFTLPICAIVLALGISQIGNNSKSIQLRIGNVWSDYHNGMKQEKLDIGNFNN